MPLRLFQVDAFTGRVFGGNPAAVVPLDGWLPDATLQSIATENNLSETAFFVGSAGDYHIRWMTPASEVDLCGHATLATAHVLWTEGLLAPEATARFHTRSGWLTADRRGDWIELDFPVQTAAPQQAPPELLGALGVRPQFVGRNRTDYLIEVAGEAEVRGLTPDFGRLRTLPIRGVIVTSRASTAGVDFVSRFFAPGVGVDEDPVTGSAHCALAPHWTSRLSKIDLVGYQASPRGGTVRVRVAGDRVKLAGQAVTVLRGELV